MSASIDSYYAVIFSNRLKASAYDDGYEATAARMVELAQQQPGFLGVESARDQSMGITISYWKDEASIKAWRNEAEHTVAREMGRTKFYQNYHLRVARVEREYEFEAE
ncbi:hypothetical protein BTA51_01185 [Hahella sp. CCB-MM4]|uniref:antibiotic biosynthesis monooxygenase family protein n=1 Tax=Hahella sp. (strain CCB-MM4) TaxID=1926491 RepID=UPI000BD54C12|nr:antibiotic biosynthesis monooxygenase [Hahella sp. CCB-MM4]OZG75044.1 hypothetical protein BTA51_01185 [Hahella sp. CCB-MM4]